MSNILLWFLYVFSLYAFIPGIVSRIFGYRVFKRGTAQDVIALTFDDGPDPQYTERLLDLLKEHGVKATFFIIGRNAERYPHIIKRMHAEGHEIGIHNYVHRSNWLMRPRTVKAQIERTSQIIESLTGEKPKLYRPPWGIMNLFDFATRDRFQIILWSAMMGDWRARVGPKRLTERMRKHLKSGAVYLLHDCGTTFGADEDAPKNTIEALAAFIPEVKSRGYSLVGIEELMQQSGRSPVHKAGIGKRLVVGLWLLWERIYHWIFKLQPVTGRNSFLHLRVTTYNGPELEMKDGEKLIKGDKIVEIHLDNKLLYEYGMKSRSSVQLAIHLIRAMDKSLPLLISIIRERSDAAQIKGLYGVTMINRGVEQFGFTVAELPKGMFATATKLYLRVLMNVIHPRGKGRLQERSEMLVPKALAMSMHQLKNRYDTAAGHSPQTIQG